MMTQDSRTHTDSQLRALYNAFSQGDMAGVLGSCTPDMLFHLPGRNLLAGEYTKGAFPAMIGKVMELSAGTFREEVIDVLPGETHAAVLLLHSLQREGRDVRYRTIHLWKLRGGQFCEWWEHPQDQHAFDETWGDGQ